MKITMIKAAVVAATLTLGASASFAQTTPAPVPPKAAGSVHADTRAQLTPEQKIEKRLAHMKKKLDLSDAQVAKIKTVLEQNRATLQADRNAMKAAPKGEKKEARQKIQADRKAVATQLKAILTPEQQAKFKEMRQQNAAKRRERRMQGMHMQHSAPQAAPGDKK